MYWIEADGENPLHFIALRTAALGSYYAWASKENEAASKAATSSENRIPVSVYPPDVDYNDKVGWHNQIGQL